MRYNTFVNSIFAINKPKGITSHGVVNRIRKLTGEKRVGHGGTLDPLASGVLVIAVGRENTKRLDEYVKGEKEYLATIKLGFESETDDEEGPITPYSSNKAKSDLAKLRSSHDVRTEPSTEEILKTIDSFIGKIKQTPPAYSAIKINGKEAYKLARKGQTPDMKPRTVEIKNIELLEYNYPILKIRVTTGPGTYIRSLARDIGKKLKTGGYLSDLIRTRVNTFTLETAFDVENLTSKFT